MSDRFNEKDLTAYALGALDALDDDKVAAIEAAAKTDTALRQHIDAIAALARSLVHVLEDDASST